MGSLLVTGASGLLGRRLLRADWGEREVVGTYYTTPIETDRETVRMDVRDATQVERVFERVDPDVVVHSAAATSVEACERDPDSAHETNALGTKRVVDAASSTGARVIYLSTAYVFGDDAPIHMEDDEPAPMNHYGETKFAGEQHVRSASVPSVIARLCVLVSLTRADRADFGSWVRGRLEAGESVRLVSDQRITPTVFSDAIEVLEGFVGEETTGIFHVASSEELTRYELGREIAVRHDLDPDLVEPIPLSEMDWEAPRPRHLCLGAEKLRRCGYETTRIRTE